MKVPCTLLLLALVALLTGCQAQPAHTSADNGQVVIFSDHERYLVESYYRDLAGRYGHGRHGLPPGLARKGQLPPGIARQIQRDGVLPPGLEYHRLPTDLERRLRPLPEGYLRIQVGTDVVLMDGRTRVMVDVIKDVAL